MTGGMAGWYGCQVGWYGRAIACARVSAPPCARIMRAGARRGPHHPYQAYQAPKQGGMPGMVGDLPPAYAHSVGVVADVYVS